MPSLQIEIPAENPLIALADAKNFLRVEFDDDDDLINALVAAGTDICEGYCNRSFIKKGYIMTLDSFPYFADTQLSQNAMPPSTYSLPLYSTTLWNYSQQIKLWAAPLISVDALVYMSSADSQWHALVPTPPVWYPLTAYALGATVADGNGNIQKCTAAGKSAANPPNAQGINGTIPVSIPNVGYAWATALNGTTTESTEVEWQNMGPVPQQDPIVGGSQGAQFGSFIVDTNSEPARLFPGPAGNYWPPVLYMPNAVQIHFTAGYGADPEDVPGGIVAAVMQFVSFYYENRDPAAVKSRNLPDVCKSLLDMYKVWDICPTRG